MSLEMICINLFGPRTHFAVEALSRFPSPAKHGVGAGAGSSFLNDSRAHVRPLVQTAWYSRTESGEVHEMIERECNFGSKLATYFQSPT